MCDAALADGGELNKTGLSIQYGPRWLRSYSIAEIGAIRSDIRSEQPE